MAKYRSKPVEVEAVKVSELITQAKEGWNSLPEWVMNEYESGFLTFMANSIHLKDILIAWEGDWLINNDHNISVCKGKDFEKLYDEVVEGEEIILTEKDAKVFFDSLVDTKESNEVLKKASIKYFDESAFCSVCGKIKRMDNNKSLCTC